MRFKKENGPDGDLIPQTEDEHTPNGCVVPRRPTGFFIPRTGSILHYTATMFDQARPSSLSSSVVRGMLMTVWQLNTDFGYFP